MKNLARTIAPVLVAIASSVAMASSNDNIIPNGDFSKGNVGFSCDQPYIEPGFNCLWGGFHTVASSFNEPLLHRLIAPESFAAPNRSTGKEKVLYLNSGGPNEMTVWESTVKVKPNTRYLVSFSVVSLSGYVLDGNPPHQVATKEWAADFEIWTNGQPSAPIQSGLGKFVRRSMIWDSKDEKTATVKIVRDQFQHGGGLYGIADIQMTPIKGSTVAGAQGLR